MRHVLLSAGTLALLASSSAQSAETITYTYDARGRLVKVERSGTVNNGVTTTYTLDKADNRTNKIISIGTSSTQALAQPDQPAVEPAAAPPPDEGAADVSIASGAYQ